MRKSRQPNPPSLSRRAGFTLVEIVIVLAITSLLAVIAFIGQQKMRDRATFDDGIDQVMQEFTEARNFSVTKVNSEGPGTDPAWVVAGDAIEFDSRNHPVGQMVEIEPHYCKPGANPAPGLSNTCLHSIQDLPGTIAACPHANVAEGECFEEEYHDPGLKLSGIWKLKIFYLTSGSSVYVCQPQINNSPAIRAACASQISAPYTFTLIDGNGNSADIQIDTDGNAKRLN